MIRAGVAALLCGMAGVLGAVPAAGAAPLTWAPAAALDRQLPFTHAAPVQQLECPSASLCIATADGAVTTTATPNAATPSWSVPQQLDGLEGLVSCASDTLCFFGARYEGKVYVSTDPGAATPTWTLAASGVFGGDLLLALSCPSASLCVAVGGSGRAYVSTNPSAAAPVWTASAAPIDNLPVTDLACASAALCVAADGGGRVVRSTDLAAAVPTWSAPAVVTAGAAPIDGVACPSVAMCALSAGDVLTSTDPTAATPTWSPHSPGTSAGRIECPTPSACIATGFGGSVLATTDVTAASPVWTQTVVNATLRDLGCASTSLCFGAVSNTPHAIRSTAPFGATPAWGPRTHVAGFNALPAAACPSDALCVAISGAGRILTTRDPTAPSPTWTRTDVTGEFRDVSCASTSLCVAVDALGFAAISENPGAATPTWTRTKVNDRPNAPFRYDAAGVSCPTTTLCALVDTEGGLVVSTTPTGAWRPRVQLPATPNAITCTAAGRCVISELGSSFVYAVPDALAASPATTQSAVFPADFATDVACATDTSCVAAAQQGGTAFTTTPFAASPAWSAPLAQGSSYVACPTATFCLGAGGGVARSSADGGATWSAPATLPGAGVRAGEVACSSSSLCAVTDEVGRVVLGVAPPESTGVPTITGAPVVGQALAATAGTWTAAPAVTRQWQRCDASGDACTPIPGATAANHTVSAADVGATLRVEGRASNRAGSGGPVTSAPTTVVLAPAATGNPPATGGTGGTGAGPAGDAGPVGGAGPATAPGANPTPAEQGPTVAAIRAALRAALRVSGSQARFGALRRRGGWRFAFAAPGAGRLEVVWRSVPATRRTNAVVLARGTATFGARQTRRVRVKLTAAGRRALRASRSRKVAIRPAFTPAGGRAVSIAGSVTLRP